ncbi:MULTISPECIES: AMP-binding protein [Gordonia]|uniref:Acyl-CoA synthetase n=1 Tax=Gordonia alkanivorans CGMCC 6845 TaxID=1423140 RepID=W9DEA5_9ACTN|nr:MULTISPECIES: AMP-binding protein [Gordonia]ETA04660.1 acyl-CoA synthetase [Gordonia alkanivorans CGMCC 6845]MDH3008769.1 AMP-binding protein [Gordonia alkanivorans]MDH3012616.1 AMP-binding protein [Gordonia alkanivorans]MDH3017662.1 AMP-binding protein [Gordonia alkanivorans]MDH3022012.1 AMP-binding protein [Gordonia alkanivorans]
MTEPDLDSSFEPLTPVSYLERAAVVHGHRIAVVDGPVRRTYADLLQRCRRQAGLLTELGVEPGDRVAVLAPNSAMLLEAHYGVAMAGGVLVALNTRLAPAELRYIVEHSGARVLLYDDSLAAAAEQTAAATMLDSTAYEHRLAGAPEVHRRLTDERTPIALNYTSGTTGKPKGVVYHHRGAYLQALSMAFHARLGPETVHLWVLPMFHCNGWSFPWALTAAGATHVCLRKVDAGEIWTRILDEGATSMNAAPTVLIDLAAHPRATRLDHPMSVGTGGAPPSPSLLAALADLDISVTHLYGLTETFGPSVLRDWQPEWDDLPIGEQAALKARQGNASVVAQLLRVVGDGDPAKPDVPADGETVGEVLIRGNTVAGGYHDDPEGTREAFGGGWFRTGDLAVVHPAGEIELRDRRKDVIISGGENIASIEVEQAMSRHPAVSEVAVVGAPHERWGEVPVAFVTPRAGAEVSPEELIEFSRSHLAGYKVPRRIVFTDLPKTGTGKIQKFALRHRIRDDSDASGPGI